MLLAWASQQSSGPATDDLDTALAALAAAGKLKSSWFLPLADPAHYLTLGGAGADVNAWAAAYGTQKVDVAFETAAPQWDASLFSARGGITFDGATQRLFATGGNIANWPADTDNFWMLAAVRNDTATNGVIRRCAAFGATASTQRAIGTNRALGTSLTSFIGGASGNSGAGDFGGAHTVGCKFVPAGNTFPYLDGVADGVGTSSASMNLTRTNFRIGAGAAAAASQFWLGAIVALAIFDTSALDADVLAVEALFRARLS